MRSEVWAGRRRAWGRRQRTRGIRGERGGTRCLTLLQSFYWRVGSRRAFRALSSNADYTAAACLEFGEALERLSTNFT